MNAHTEDLARRPAAAIAPGTAAAAPAADGPAPQAEAETETASPVPFFVAAALLLAGWAASTAVFGLPGLFVPALLSVPVIFFLLIAVSWG